MKQRTTLFQKVILIILGIALSLSVLEAGLRLSGLALLAIQERRNTVSLERKGAYRILCLGESTTQRQYPPFLEAALNRNGAGLHFTVIDEGLAGTTTDVILSRVEHCLDKYHPDMVVAMMGVNDRGAPHMPSETPSASKTVLLLRSLKIYRLARLLFYEGFGRSMRLSAGIPKREGIRDAAGSRPASPYRKVTEAVQDLAKELQLDPGNVRLEVKLGNAYVDRGRFQEAEACFKNALDIDPGNEIAYCGLGRVYRKQSRYQESETFYKKALKLNPRCDLAYDGLGNLSLAQRRLRQAEAYYKKILPLNPRNEWAYIGLGRTAGGRDNFGRRREFFKKALRVNPDSKPAHFWLGELYLYQWQSQQDEERLQKVRRRNNGGGVRAAPGRRFPDGELLRLAEEQFKEALLIDPGAPEVLAGLERVHRVLEDLRRTELLLRKNRALTFKAGAELSGQIPNARESYRDSAALTLPYPASVPNYHKLKAVLDRRKVRLVCVQYPMRDVAPLKSVFKGRSDGIVFVDNEKLFADAVMKNGYNPYFADLFAGDFGHCTPEGNQLLGENIARAILTALDVK